MFKIHMQKAYDSVEWHFLEEVLAGMQLPHGLISWIMCCVRSVTYSIMINGCPSSAFKAKRGVRQEDPLSPYLFVLVMDYLTRLLKTLKIEKHFKYHLRCHKQHIMQLSFAEDLLLFSRGELTSAKMIYNCFQQFSMGFELIVNQAKSCIYFWGVSENMQKEILQYTKFIKGLLPFRYLDVPLIFKSLSIGQF